MNAGTSFRLPPYALRMNVLQILEICSGSLRIALSLTCGKRGCSVSVAVRAKALLSEECVTFPDNKTREFFAPADSPRRAEDLVARERVRLARQLHDEVASAMFATKLELDVAAHLAANGTAIETLQAALDDATSSANQALSTIRGICAELREFGREEVDVFGELTQLLRAFEQRTGAQCLLSVRGDCSALVFGIDTAARILSIVREKLESVASPPGVRRIQVDVRASERRCDLKIRFHSMGAAPARRVQEDGFLPEPGLKNSEHREGVAARAPGVARKNIIAVTTARGSEPESRWQPSPPSRQAARKTERLEKGAESCGMNEFDPHRG
jgi:hypothetical protein